MGDHDNTDWHYLVGLKELIVLFCNKCTFKYVLKHQIELESILNYGFLVVVVDLVLSFYSISLQIVFVNVILLQIVFVNVILLQIVFVNVMSLQIVFVNVMSLQIVFVNVMSLQIVFVNVILYCYKSELSSH